MRKKLVLAGEVDPSLLRYLENDGRFEVLLVPVRDEDALVGIAAGAEVLVTRSYHRVTRRVLEAARRLELVAQGTSGTDNIDLDAAAERGITVVSTPGINANAVAELVFGCIVALTRGIPSYTRELVESAWNRDDCATRHELRHHRLGIVGLGQTGMRVARIAAFFGMRVAAYDPYLADAEFVERHAVRIASLEALLTGSDIVTLHVPLTTETRRMISAPAIALMPAGSLLINTSRGEVLDQAAALDALARNHLSGLALDVFDPEPPLDPFPDDPRLILTPHIAGCSHEARSAIGQRLYEQIVAFYATQD